MDAHWGEEAELLKVVCSEERNNISSPMPAKTDATIDARNRV
jgi:hypothetical protein